MPPAKPVTFIELVTQENGTAKRFELKASRGRRKVGEAIGVFSPGGSNFVLSKLFVIRSQRRRGIATRIIRRIIERFGGDRDIHLSAYPFEAKTDHDAMRTVTILLDFYKKHGFENLGRCRDEGDTFIYYKLYRKKNPIK